MDEKKLDDFIRRYEEVYFYSSRIIHTMLTEHALSDLTHEQFFLLRTLKQKGTSTPSSLAEATLVNRSAITAMIDRLVTKGYVQRLRDEVDRRVVFLEITPEGEAVFEQVSTNVRKYVETYLHQFDVHEIEFFLHIYEKIAQILEKQIGGLNA